MRRLEGEGKVRGSTGFTEDLQLPGLLHAKLVLSHVASGRIKGIEGAGLSGVYTAADLSQATGAGPDLPLARDRVYYAGQPVVAVLAESPAAAADLAQQVFVDYEPLAAVLDPFQAMKPEAAQVLDTEAGLDVASIHGGSDADEESSAGMPRNVTGQTRKRRGDVAAALGASEVVIEATYRMPGAHQGFLEPHIAAAHWDSGRLTVWTPTQGHFNVRDTLAKMLSLPVSRVRVVAMPVGGGFGGKIVLLEPLVALLAQKSGRPVVLNLTRSEEFLVGRAAPAFAVQMKVGAMRDGTLTGLQAHMTWDNGATSGWHSGIAELHLGDSYRFPAVEVTGYEVATNKTPADAYRAPGGTQAFFALESALDELAVQLGMDPIELRLKNAPREGDPRGSSTWGRHGLVECLEAARRHPLYTAAREPGEGVGVAVGGWGGAYNPASAGCRVESDGTLTVQVGSVDISGSATSLAIIAAEAFGIAPELVEVETGDTGIAPWAGVSGGSMTIYSVGPAVVEAARAAKRQLLEIAAEHLEAAPDDLEVKGGEVGVKGVPERRIPIRELLSEGGSHPPIHGQGRAAIDRPSPAFTVHIARVKVDRETGGYKLTGYAAIQDVGRAINPPEVEGQVHGGALQGLARALGEALVHDDQGQLKTGTFLDYPLPTADQVPMIDVQLVEVPSDLGPFGARHVGEPPAVPGPAALANAIASATGVRCRDLPISGEALIA